jgi:hypothetical protein
MVGMVFPEMVVRGVIRRVKTKVPPKDFEGTNFPPVWEKITRTEKGVSLYARNILGNAVFMPVWVSESDLDAMQYLLPNTTISVSSKKNIVTTQLVNRDGSVKEEISLDDWSIDIKGVIVSGDSSYPDWQVQQLVDWYKKRVPLNIQNAKTAMCLEDDERVIIEDLRLPEVNGYENTQPFQMSLKSDLKFTLFID